MLLLKTNQVLKTLDGKELQEGDTKITVGLLISNILSNTNSNPHRSYQLAKSIATNDTVELKAEDVVFIKEIVNAHKTLGALYTGQLVAILEV